VLGVEVASRTEVETVRRGIRQVISERAYSPVFQPIVDIMQNEVVGYEALTRFHDGAAPDVRFEEAAKVGLGVELELATLEAALNAAADLPAAAWLNVNASPELVFAGTGLAAIVAGSKRDLVLEVTEHSMIGNYDEFRAAVKLLGPRIGVAVDDAGAGFASLQHILELRPSIVKLDRALVTGIDTDKARRAMAAGMHHFARASGIRLIAEGVETEGELATLRELDIHLAQGYLLGAPAPVPRSGPPKRRAARPAAKKMRKVAALPK
jgi:EAL domain-containing protein (putative c-di-GMP-specific phosphodiesterase class I)